MYETASIVKSRFKYHGAELQFIIAPTTEGEEVKSSTFKHFVFNPEKDTFDEVEEWKASYSEYLLDAFRAINRKKPAAETAADFRHYVDRIIMATSESEDPYWFIGNNYVVYDGKIYTISGKDGKEKYVEMCKCSIDGDVPVICENCENPLSSLINYESHIFEFGPYLCFETGDRLIIFSAEKHIVLQVAMGLLSTEKIYINKNFLAFGETLIFNSPEGLEVFEHETLGGVMCIGERVVVRERGSIFLI